MVVEVVVFDYAEFSGMFPEVKTTKEQAETSFWIAEGIVNNTSTAFVSDFIERKRILYILTAHIITLTNRGAGNVGAISGAHEGSVGVNYSTATIDKLGAGWFGQTQYGLLFWQLCAKYLSGFYVP